MDFTKMDRRRFLPSFNVLRSFESAARFESFTLAAEELNLTQSAISRHIKELETVLGFEVFRRSGRRVILTKAGSNLADDLTVDLDRIKSTLFKAVSSGSEKASLKIATLPTFASRWLIPRLPDFQEKHPGIEINLSTRMKTFDFQHENFDLAIHFGENNWPDTDMTKLCDELLLPVCSPGFVKKHKISEVSDVFSAPLLHISTRPNAWNQWLKKEGYPSETLLPGKRFDQFSMVISGALASIGVGLVPDYHIERELEAGSLVALRDEPLRTEMSYFLVTPEGQHDDKVAIFNAWIATQVRQR